MRPQSPGEVAKVNMCVAQEEEEKEEEEVV